MGPSRILVTYCISFVINRPHCARFHASQERPVPFQSRFTGAGRPPVVRGTTFLLRGCRSGGFPNSLLLFFFCHEPYSGKTRLPVLCPDLGHASTAFPIPAFY